MQYVASELHASGDDLQQIAALVQGAPEAEVLDLGCGGGHVAYAVAPLVRRVVAYDLSSAMLDAVARTALERGLNHIETRQGVAEHLPFADSSFDFVLSRYSTHHWQNLDAGLREAGRVLKPGGRAVFADLITPHDAALDSFLQSIELLRDPSHVRSRSAVEWHGLLAQAGLRVVSLTQRRLRLDFASWVARIATPEAHVVAIRSLQAATTDAVRHYFSIEPDGSFTTDIMVIETVHAAGA
jgi:SAM-dependent methyltransferase